MDGVKVRTVLGVDIHPMASPRSRTRRYAATYVEDGLITREYEEISFKSLLRVVRALKPDCLAVDNVYELAKGAKDLKKVLSMLPSKTVLVQVTGSPSEGMEPLVAVARRHGFRVGEKLTPLQTARIVAKLAYMGVGYYLKGFEEETLIIVSKKLTPSAGGMSMDRYERRVRTGIISVGREVEAALREAGLDYDVYRGRKSIIFVVSAPRERLAGVVKPYDGYGIRVSIKPVPRAVMKFEPLSGVREPQRPRSYLIVGYDPGIRAGLAILDLKSKLLYLKSGHFITKSDVIRIITEYGKPVIVASDVSPAPRMVRRIASVFQAVLYTPGHDMSSEEKRKTVSEFVEETHYGGRLDSHMIDALAAALKAYNHYKPKFDKIEQVAQRRGVPADVVKAMFLRGVKIGDAVNMLIKARVKPERRVERQEVKAESGCRKRLSLLKSRVEELEDTVRSLEERLRERDRAVEELEERLRTEREKLNLAVHMDREYSMLRERLASSERMVKKLKSRVEELEATLKSYEDVARLVSRGLYTPLIYIPVFSLGGIKEILGGELGGRDPLIFIGDGAAASPEIVEELLNIKPKLIMFGREPPEWVVSMIEEKSVPVYIVGSTEPKVEIKWLGKTPFAEASPLSSFIKARGEELRERNLARMRERILKMIRGYGRD